jgi:hypothetical protein
VTGLWIAVVLLVMVGVTAAVGRGLFLPDLARRADPVRQRAMMTLQRSDPFLARRPEELARFDGRFADNPVPTLLHVLPGGLFLVLAPLQFIPRIRDRHLQLHRWSGRLLLSIGLVATLAGLYFGLRMPYGGMAEAAAIAVFGGLFGFALVRAFVSIRTGRVASHREWMIRAFAIALGISTVRIVSAVLDFAFTPAGLPPPALFALSLWVGWASTLAAAELWIRYTRPRSGTRPAAVSPVVFRENR